MIASTGTAKLHYDSAFVGSNWAVVTWEDGGGPSHTNAMRFNADGTLGMALPSPYEFTAEVTGANIHFSWQMSETFAPPVSYKLYQDGVMLIQFPNTGSAYNLDNVPAGTHEYYLTAVWESGESQPSNAISVTIEGSYPPPTNLWWETGDEIYTLVFHWTIPDTPILPTGYRFYNANGDILLFSVNEGAANSVTVPFDQTAMHMYMTAVYSETHESEPSNGITVIVANDDPNVTSVPLQVTASPNPFRNGVNLAFEGVKSSEAVSVVIYNLKGQEVRKWSNLNRNTHQLTWDGLDVAQQPVSSGIYFARITNGKAQQTIKLLKF
jgi:hypothetical protein